LNNNLDFEPDDYKINYVSMKFLSLRHRADIYSCDVPSGKKRGENTVFEGYSSNSLQKN